MSERATGARPAHDRPIGHEPTGSGSTSRRPTGRCGSGSASLRAPRRPWALALALGLACRSDPPAPETSDPVWAVVDGEPIRRSDVVEGIAFEVYRREMDLYGLYEREARRLVDERLLARAAAAGGTTPARWLEAEAVALAEPPGPAEVDAYLEARNLGPERRPRVEAFLRERARIEAEIAVLARLREDAAVDLRITPPEPPRVRIDLAEGEAEGPAEAPIVIVTSGSVRDPRARALMEVAAAYRDAHPERIRWAHRSLPRWGDEIGLRIARWALRATELGRKPRLVRALLGAGSIESVDAVDALAEQVGLDAAAPLGEVKRAAETARRVGLREGPAALVDGLYVDGSYGRDRLQATIERRLGGGD